MTTATMSRVEELQDLQDRARSVDVRNDSDFQDILRDARSVLEMSESQIADALSISRPTFNRWINGRSLPHIAMRTPAITWMLDQLNRKIKHRSAYSHVA
jgi:DNA-binding transcriptional regulator YiaG